MYRTHSLKPQTGDPKTPTNEGPRGMRTNRRVIIHFKFFFFFVENNKVHNSVRVFLPSHGMIIRITSISRL